MTTQEALDILHEHTKKPNLRKHMYAIAAAMRAYARKLGEDEEKWNVTGLLHDFDYEGNPSPESHPMRGVKILRERGCPEDIIHAIMGHADYLGVERVSLLDKALFAVDELCGFIIAVALVHPDKKLAEVKVSSIEKKLKQKSFARQVSRDDIEKGIAELAVDREEHFALVLNALQDEAEKLGL